MKPTMSKNTRSIQSISLELDEANKSLSHAFRQVINASYHLEKYAQEHVENQSKNESVAQKQFVAHFYYPEHGNGALIKREVIVQTACDKYITGTERNSLISTKNLPVVKKFLKSKVIGLDILLS